MNKILVFGNPLLKEDNMAILVAKELKLKNIVFCERAEQLMQYSDDLIILDVIKGLKEVKVLKDINKIKEFNMKSLHDFDVGYFLKLLKAMGRVGKVKIIGIPISGDKEKIKNDVKEILSKSI